MANCGYALILEQTFYKEGKRMKEYIQRALLEHSDGYVAAAPYAKNLA